MSVKSMEGGAGTARPSASPSGAAVSFSRDLQQMLNKAGETAQAGNPGKAKGAGEAGAAADPKTRKNNSPGQEMVAAGSSAMPLPGAFAAGAQAWNLDAGRPLASAAGNSPDGAVSAPGAYPQPVDSGNDAPAPAGLPDTPALLGEAATGASIPPGDAGFLPETPEARGEASSVDATAGISSSDKTEPVGSGGAGLPVASASPIFGAETGFAVAARQVAAKDSAALDPRRLGGAGPVAGKGQAAAQGAGQRAEQGPEQGPTPPAPMVVSAPSIPGENTVAGGVDPASGAAFLPASGEGAGANLDAFSGFSTAVPVSVSIPVSESAVSPDPGNAGVPVPSWATGWAVGGAAGSKWKGAPDTAGPGSGGSVPFAGHLLPALTFPLMAPGGAATGEGPGGQPLLAPGGQGSAAPNGDHAAASPSGETLPTAGEVSMAATHLLQSLGRSEMQVHLHAAEFGRVSVHATYGREGIAAQISLENTDLGSALGSALSAHLPAMEQRLGADGGVRASVSVSTETGAGAGNGGGQGSDGSPRRALPPLPPPLGPSLPAIDTPGLLLSTPAPAGVGNGRRLDIRI